MLIFNGSNCFPSKKKKKKKNIYIEKLFFRKKTKKHVNGNINNIYGLTRQKVEVDQARENPRNLLYSVWLARKSKRIKPIKRKKKKQNPVWRLGEKFILLCVFILITFGITCWHVYFILKVTQN
jgi:hypothetical protein